MKGENKDFQVFTSFFLLLIFLKYRMTTLAGKPLWVKFLSMSVFLFLLLGVAEIASAQKSYKDLTFPPLTFTWFIALI